MKTILTSSAGGFCGGVARAVAMAEKALAQKGRVYCLGKLLHNEAEIARLEALGMVTVDSVDEIPDGAAVLLRAHGEGPAVYEALRRKGAEIYDATCGRVAHIHRLAREAEERGQKLIVFGDPEHPEVRGVCGWCRNTLTVRSTEELEKLLQNDPKLAASPLRLLFQSTQTEANLKKSKEIAKKWCTNCDLFDTICCATQIRQKEALELASRCDAMVVLGGKDSANSRHLADLCAQRCAHVLFLANAEELDTAALQAFDTIGITAGASVPARILKEVTRKMDEIRDTIETTETAAAEAVPAPAAEPAGEAAVEKIEAPQAETPAAGESAEAAVETEKSFAELLEDSEDSIKTIYNGDVVKGVVAAITPTEVTVDLGTKHSGYIPVEEFQDDNGTSVEELIHIGDTVEASVVRVNDVEGTVMLSKRRLDAVKNWDDVEAACENDTIVEGIVTEENKGGIVVKVKGLRVFVPASQSGLPRDAEMSQLLRQKVRLYITEVNRPRRRIVGSIRKVAARARHEAITRIWDEIEVGKRYHGTVKSLTSYGAFVDIGGVDGMVHVSELSWKRITKPADVVSVGDELDVYVINFDRNTRKISLGYKDPNENPWDRFMSQYQVGDVASVRIVKLMTFGAFAEIVPGVDGLIHISQIANRRIGKPDEVLAVGDIVDVKITAIDEDKHKVSLSIRALSEPAPAAERRSRPEREEKPRARADALVYEISETGKSSGFVPEITEFEE